jgi:protein-S-isoprenylcysteine O-methyltransferase Ste14
MMTQLTQRWSGHPEHLVRDGVAFASAVATLMSVAWSFLNYHRGRQIVRRQRSAVDTVTMLLFFAVFARLLAQQIGALTNLSLSAEWGVIGVGTVLMLIGCAVNVAGRHQLGATWANQVTLYEGHQLRTDGMFRWVRHPLYASTIWMFLGASLAFLNYLCMGLTCLLFIPAMHYRAAQEERLLLGHFPDYNIYRQRTGRFFPKFFNPTPKTR